MTGQVPEIYDRVGPVLQSGPVANAIIAAIKDLNQDVMVVDRGAYVRVLVPRCCVVTRSAIENHLGRSRRPKLPLEPGSFLSWRALWGSRRHTGIFFSKGGCQLNMKL